jgi:hypothetical protein
MAPGGGGGQVRLGSFVLGVQLGFVPLPAR